MRLDPSQIAQFTEGSLVLEPADSSAQAQGITWDSREVNPGDLYVALPGERVDGHSFIPAAFAAGAAGALVMQQPSEQALQAARAANGFIVLVDDTFAAITNLARGWRGMLQGKVIGLTGSSGKTTTKNLVRDVLSRSFKVVATKANQNNELGVPRTLLNADEDTDFVVVEMGMRGMGQISSLCEFVQPDMGIIVNVGESHIELLGGRDNIARAKSELFQALPSSKGIAFVNGADDYASFCCQQGALQERAVSICGYGLDFDNSCYEQAVWAEDVNMDALGATTFTLCARGFSEAETIQRIACSLSLQGLHNVSNAMGAAAIGLTCGMDLQTIAEALASVVPESGRQEVLKAASGYTVINDAYNANPESMKASLVTFSAMKAQGKHIAVLGDMGELGDFAPACHQGIGNLIPTLNIDYLICVGELSAYIAQAAAKSGMDSDKILQICSTDEALAALQPLLASEDAVLVKASHFMGLTRVVEGLMN